jgi:hypothetical protein
MRGARSGQTTRGTGSGRTFTLWFQGQMALPRLLRGEGFSHAQFNRSAVWRGVIPHAHQGGPEGFALEGVTRGHHLGDERARRR